MNGGPDGPGRPAGAVRPPGAGGRLTRWLAALPVPLLLIALVALSGIALGRIYRGPLLAQVVLGAAVGAIAVSAALRRAPAWSVAPVSVLAMTGYVAWTLRFTADRATVPGALLDLARDALPNGISRLLTAMIPVEPQPDTVVIPVIAAWLAALSSFEVSVRAGRTLLGFLPSAMLYAGALYVVGPNATPALWPTLAYAALAALGLAVTGRPSRAAPAGAGPADGGGNPIGLDATARAALRLRLAASTAAGLAVVVAIGALLGPAVAGQVSHHPVDPRRYVQPPQLDALDENPLIRLSGWALSPDQPLFDLGLAGPTGTDTGDTDTRDTAHDDTDGGGDTGGGDGDQGATGDQPVPAGQRADLRIRLAVLSDYDGVTWRVGATYRSAGRALPPAPTVGDAPTRTIRQDVTVANLSGRLMPAAATPQLVNGVRVAYDPVSGTLIRPEGLLPGVRYTVDSTFQPLEVNLLSGANVPSGPEVARMLSLGPGVPEQIDRLARQLGTDSGAPYDRAMAIEEFLAEHYRLVADAPSGHAYPNLSFFLFGPRNGGGQRGTSEQFAASFALLARLLGLPARVVVGFRAPADGGTVRAADALAWPEVLFDEVGWVPFNPLPQPDTKPRPVEEDFRPKPETSTEPPSNAPTLTAAPTPPASAPPAAAGDAGAGLTPAAVTALAAGALLLAFFGYAGTVPLLLRGRRRRRLGDPDPAQRVVGAWLEVTDALRLAGRPAAAHLAATEVVAHALAALRPPDRTNTPPDADAPTGPGAPTGQDSLSGALSGRDAAGGHGTAGPVVRPAVPALDGLAELVNVAAFGGIRPDPARADEVGREALAYVRQLRAQQPWWRRLLWSIHPGPLRWHR